MTEPGDYPPPRVLAGKLPWLLGLLAALLLCCCASAAAGGLTYGRQLYDGLTAEPAQLRRLGQPVRDGDLEFTVRQIDCGHAQVGGPLDSRRASGQFCLAHLTIKNVGERPATFADLLQRAYSPSGAQFNADSAAGVLANSDQQIFFNEINPGNQLVGVVVYDIPPTSRISRLELRATAESPGVSVSVD